MPPFTQDQLIELALVYTDEHIALLKDMRGVELTIDPDIMLKVIDYEEEAQAGARSIVNQLESRVYIHYTDALSDIAVRRIALLQVNDTIEVFTDLDPDFEDVKAEIDRKLDLIRQRIETVSHGRGFAWI